LNTPRICNLLLVKVRVGIQDQDQNTSEDLRCPIDEYDFWRKRCTSCFTYLVYRLFSLFLDENLLGLNYQLENEAIKHLCKILSAVQSSYVKQFRALGEEIIDNIDEAKSNIEYLNVLVEPCKVMHSQSNNKGILKVKITEIGKLDASS